MEESHRIKKDAKLGTKISLRVDDAMNAKMHTSRSRPIGPGLVASDSNVIAGYSEEGGKLCLCRSFSRPACE
ncbi:MAG: hypothetical protein NTZ17_07360 [Phycisphaerae bacterium]|nr:hypothetical protein [Phycisphaerae bacterium]